MRIQFDTNVLIAAFIARSGACAALYEHGLATHTVISSIGLLDEFEEKLVTVKALSFPLELARTAQAHLTNTMTLVEPVMPSQQVCRDRDDDLVFGSAIGGVASCIATFDQDLLVLVEYQGIPLIHARDFWAHEAQHFNE